MKNPTKNRWQKELCEHFSDVKLLPTERNRLEQLLMAQPMADLSATPSPNTRQFIRVHGIAWLSRLHRSGLGYATTAVATALLTLVGAQFISSETDPIDELTATAKPYPPDFDLEGDASALQEIIHDLLPSESFGAEIPRQVQAIYAPGNGRFFSWEGVPGVRISLVPHGMESAKSEASLYIVRLTKGTDVKFPKDKISKKYGALANKEKRVKVWREGKYGYALVQYVAENSPNPAFDENR